ncbi:DUF4214 domain-containing protein [Methylobacterium sp. E-066]|uniref:DUF4214 domain-containing protein n=1 Tax=Methylobacterium sp. E-066 TaxID=2836584 RepID=UPI001FBAD3AD|nr:DUF4214 domain-containing protein [Methylobacterium sp. E-066]MCJ2144259.1 DUF4214 domain-containing protein [Methylobacterium sp. E-066]
MPSIDLTGYRLTFDDEFGARSISQTGAGTTWADIRSEWRFDANSDIGFGHSSFVDPSSGYDPFSVQGGALAITAVPDRTASGYPGSWESGLITTQGNFSQTYGYFEIRADLSGQAGAWDAFWLLPNQQKPDPNNAGGHQELDIIEHYGSNDRGVYSTIHTTDPQNGVRWQDNRQVYSEMSDPSGYHTYGMNWQADRISYYVDGHLVGSQATPSDMHDPMYLLVNLATQNSGSNNADAAGMPITSRIDYVRAYSNDPQAMAVVQGTVSAPDGHDPGLYGATAGTSAHAGVGQGIAPANGGSSPATVAPSAPSPSLAMGHDVHSPDGEIFALYEGILGRAPDAAGGQSWVAALNAGTSLHDITQAFLDSPEGQARLGAASSADFVARLYDSVLGRHADAAAQNWIYALDHGTSRADVADAFVFSDENIAQLQAGVTTLGSTAQAQPQPTAGGASWITDATDASIARLYYGLLGRAPDADGFHSWEHAADNGIPLTSIAQTFLSSDEYISHHGSQTDQAFVESLYQEVLGRHADASGEQSWLYALSHSASRGDVAMAIVDSPEAQQHLAAEIQQGWHLS